MTDDPDATSPPDPRTLEAIRKIRDILTEYDLAGAMTVISPERAHWVYHLGASWSGLHIDSENRQATVRIRRRDFKTDGEYNRVLELTEHIIFQGIDLGVRILSDMRVLAEALAEQFDVTHEGGLDERHDQ